MLTSSVRPASLRRVCSVGAMLAVSVLSCGREPTAPHGSDAVRYSRALSWISEFPEGVATFQASGGSGVDFTSVHIVLRNPDNSIALDTVVNFPAGETELKLTLAVPLPASAPATGQPLALNLEYKNAAGEIVFKGGPVTVNAVPQVPGGAPPPPSPVTIPIQYTGPGADAVGVRITPKALTVNTGGTFSFTAVAVDANGNPVPNTPIVFASTNPTLAIVNAATGSGAAGATRGNVEIVAQLLTGPTDAAALTIQAPPSALELVSGSGQTGLAGATLAQPVAVKATATDGLPAPNIPVTFTAANGGAVGAATVNTDVNGIAQTTWTLGNTAGPQTLTATAAGLSGSPVGFTATAISNVAVRLEFESQPTNAMAGSALLPPVTVKAVDAAGTINASYTGPISLTLGAGAPAGAILGGATTLNAVDGIATFADLTLNLPGTYSLAAAAADLVGATSSPFVVLPGNASRLVFQNYPVIGAVAGAVLDAITVEVRDVLGNKVTAFTGEVTLTADGPLTVAASQTTANFVAGASAGTNAHAILGTTKVNAVAGVATFSGLQLTQSGNFTLSASAADLVGATGPVFPIRPAAASSIVLVSGGGQEGVGAAALASPILVRVVDQFGNGVSGVTVGFTPAVGNGNVIPTTAVTGADGSAQTVWTLLGTAGTKTLAVTAPDLDPLAVTATATTSSGTARVWNGSSSSSFTDPLNWTPAGVPESADPLTIAAVGSAPVISSPVTIGSLVILPGATLTNSSTLTIGGSIDAGPDIGALRDAIRAGAKKANVVIGSGEIVLNGSAGTIAGAIYSNLTILSGAYTLAGPTAVNGSVAVASSGKLDIGTSSLYVNDDFTTATGGRLAMTNSSANMYVEDGATFGGGSTFGMLTAGTAEFNGDFAATGSAYSASGTHLTRFVGNNESTQTITVNSPPAGQGVNHANFDGIDYKVLEGAPVFLGDVIIEENSGPVMAEGINVRVGGNFADYTYYYFGGPNLRTAQSRLLANEYGFYGYSAWYVEFTEFFGANKTINTAFLPGNITISGSISLITDPYGCDCALAGISSSTRASARSNVVYAPYMEVAGDVTVSGSSGLLTLNGSELMVDNNFATMNGGRVALTDEYDYLVVQGNATFAGGSTAGLLTAGEIFVRGNVTQGGGSPSAFAPNTDFYTYLGDYYYGLRDGGSARVRAHVRAGDARSQAAQKEPSARFARERAERDARHARLDRQAVAYAQRGFPAPSAMPRVGRGVAKLANSFVNPIITFANPTTSFFGALYISAPYITLGSDITVMGSLETGGGSGFFVQSTDATQRIITSHGADIRYAQFENVRWILLDGTPVWDLDYISFYNMSPTVDQFTVSRSGDLESGDPTYYMYDWYFQTTPTTGNYIRATDTSPGGAGGANVVTLDMAYTSPSAHGGHVATAGGAVISGWPTTFAWLGTMSTNWDDGANWTTGFYPWTNDDVTIPSGAPNSPVLSSTAFVRNLTVEAGRTVDLNGNVLGVFGSLMTPTGTESVLCGSGGTLGLKGSGTVSGNVCIAQILGTYSVGAGNRFIVGTDLQIAGSGASLALDGGRVDVGGADATGPGIFGTYSGGTLTMNNSADQLFIGSGGAFFDGGSTAGLLTAGTMTMVNSAVRTTSGAADAFAPGGTHKTIFNGPNNGVNFFDPASSFFRDMDILGGSSLFLESDAKVGGTFARGPGAGSITVGSADATTRSLKTGGITQSGSDAMTFSNVVFGLEDGSANTAFSNVIFAGFPSATPGPLFKINRSGGPFTFSMLDFSGAGFSASGSNHFVENAGSANITISSSSPTSGTLGIEFLRTGSGTVSWP